MTGFLLRGKPTVVYALSPGITMRLAIPAYSYRHGLNIILGIVKTRIGCSSGITYPSLIVMGPGLEKNLGTSPILSPTTVLLHCYYSASYLITLFCPGGVACPPYTDCYPTAPSLLCGWSDGLEWAPRALRLTPVAHSALFLSSLVLRPHCLTEVGLGALLSRFP